MMTPPKKPEFKAIKDLKTTEELFERLELIERQQRTDLLVRYLGDLKREFDVVAEELSDMGFCARCYLQDWYLEEEEDDDGDGDDGGPEPVRVH